jgi:hypothetical protein
MTSKIEPWERQQGETAKAYEAFVIYRDMGLERSLAKVGRRLGISTKYIERLSKRWRWRERTRAFDGRIERVQTEDAIEAAEKANRRHIAESQQMQGAVLKFLKEFDPQKLKAADVPVWMKAAIDIERKCMGLDSTATQVAVGVQVNVGDKAIMLATRLYPKAVSMLTDGQKAELEEYRRQVEDGTDGKEGADRD